MKYWLFSLAVSLVAVPAVTAAVSHQCSSVHLYYGPNMAAHTAAYSEAVVEKSAPGTYFSINCFGEGYIGVQELGERSRTPRVAIFSIWDAKPSGDNPNAAPESERALLIQKGAGVVTDRFGGEGTGGKSMKKLDWKEGDVLRTLVIEKPDGDKFRQIAGYFYNESTKQWELMSCWRIQAVRHGLGHGSGFVEDFFGREGGQAQERRATYGPAYRYLNGTWYPAMEFTFSKDKNPNMQVNCRYNEARGAYSLATGGAITPEADFPVYGKKRVSNAAPAPEGAEQIQALIDAPLMERIEYSAEQKRL